MKKGYQDLLKICPAPDPVLLADVYALQLWTSAMSALITKGILMSCHVQPITWACLSFSSIRQGNQDEANKYFLRAMETASQSGYSMTEIGELILESVKDLNQKAFHNPN